MCCDGLELPPTQDAIVTTRTITFFVGNPYSPSFVTVTEWGVDPSDGHFLSVELLVFKQEKPGKAEKKKSGFVLDTSEMTWPQLSRLLGRLKKHC